MTFDLNLFIEQNFLNPIKYTSGFTWVNTLVYAVILLGIAFLIVYPLFNKKGIKFDLKFFLALLPFIIFGSALRVLTDLSLWEKTANPLDWRFYTVTPGIYLLVGLTAIIGLALILLLSKKMNWKAIIGRGSLYKD